MQVAGIRYRKKRAKKILADPKYGSISRRAALRALQLWRATPKWLDKAQIKQMQRIYADAKQRGLSVDHIVPLNSAIVCGLHVPWNLTAMSMERNLHKSNKFWPDCPFEQPGLEFAPIQRSLI